MEIYQNPWPFWWKWNSILSGMYCKSHPIRLVHIGKIMSKFPRLENITYNGNNIYKSDSGMYGTKKYGHAQQSRWLAVVSLALFSRPHRWSTELKNQVKKLPPRKSPHKILKRWVPKSRWVGKLTMIMIRKHLRASAIDTDVSVRREAGGEYVRTKSYVPPFSTYPRCQMASKKFRLRRATYQHILHLEINSFPWVTNTIVSKLYWFYTFFGAVRRPEKMLGFCDASTLFSLWF